ncbi:MAG: uroporphyrinogen decarboxylase [Myxococcota bacterium]
MSAASQREGFAGAGVAAFESRRAVEIAKLVEHAGGRALVGPTMREVPIGENPQAFAFGEALLRGEIDVLVCLTGVGTRFLLETLETRTPREAIVAAIGRVAVVARGPKPTKVLGEYGIPIALKVPERNTWRELLAAIDAQFPVAGKRVVVQEYGVPNERLVDGLRARGAEVRTIAVYRWALPLDLDPLERVLRAIAAGEPDVALFTSAQQVPHMLSVARNLGLEDAVRATLGGMAIGSIGPTCSESLEAHGLRADYEPSHPRMGTLVAEMAERWRELRVARGWPSASHVTAPAAAPAALTPSGGLRQPDFEDTPFMRACRRKPVPYTPVWLMRQAGRYMAEYREVRAKVPFLELCKRPDLVAEVTTFAAERLGVDAAIIFADILLVAEPLGLALEFTKGDGPVIRAPVRTGADVDHLRDFDPAALGYVYEAIRKTRLALRPSMPLIGFAGAPFTVASYLIEGETSRSFRHAKALMYRDAGAWHALLARLADATAKYLNAQVDAGVQALQLFDSWVGALSPSDYREFVLPHMKALFSALRPGVPVIHFGTDTATLLPLMREAGGDVIGLDWRVELDEAWARLGGDVGVMGNLDPIVLYAERATIRERTRRILAQAGGRPGHVFNLGHGILPDTPVENVVALVEEVHALSAR